MDAHKRIGLAVVVSLCVASSAGAQCLGDFDDDGSVEINELITAVNNSLNGCSGVPTPTMPPGGACPINFGDDNTAAGTADCFYIGRWNQSCGADDLEAWWISDGIDDDGEVDLVIVELLDFTPGLFLAGEVTSPTSADLFAWFTNPNPEPGDLMDTSGNLTLNASGNVLVIDPDAPPFSIDQCQLVRYEGTLTEVSQPSASLRTSSVRLSPEVVQSLRERRAAVRLRPNFERK
jgi:hypothetical protein